MNKEIEIPEGYEARIESNKVIIEQKEGEDEKIRKVLLEYFNERDSYRDEDETFNGVPFSSIIAYLEKQKDQKPAERVEINKSLSDAVISELGKYNGENYWKSPWAMDSTGTAYPLYFANLGATWQKEQKPTESPEDIHNRGYIKGVEDAYNNVNEAKVILKRLAKEDPKPTEWSEEDEDAIEQAIIAIEDMRNSNEPGVGYVGHKLSFDVVIERLKSLHPQSHWKPSEKQMEALRCAVNDSIMQYDYNASQLKEEVTRTYSENLQSLLNDLNKL